MPILYINPLPKEIQFTIIENSGEILYEQKKLKNNDEFSFFPESLVELVDTYSVNEIWCVVGPGPFTLMRIVTLAINSISYARNISVKSCSFFEIVPRGENPILEANAREYLIQDNHQTISIPKDELPSGSYTGIFTKNDFADGKTLIEYEENYPHIEQLFQKKSPESRLTPLYFKPPNITCSTKTM